MVTCVIKIELQANPDEKKYQMNEDLIYLRDKRNST